MGCGAGKEDAKKEDQQQQKDSSKQQNNAELEKKLKDTEKKLKDTEQKLSQAQNELDALKKEKKAREEKAAAAAVPAPAGAPVEGGVSFQIVMTAKQVDEVSKMPNTSLFFVQGAGAKLHEDAENVIIVTTKADNIANVVNACQCPPTIERVKPAKPEAAPPKVENEVEKADEEEEEEKPKIQVPAAEVEVSGDINLGEWDGEVPINFKWVDEPSAFSEYNDPTGINWNAFTNIRKAPGKPEKISLEWRQGMTGEWTEVPAVVNAEGQFEVNMSIKPEKIEGSAYRGYQSRWVVDGDKYLSPLQLAPTLQSKLMTYPTVRSAIKALPEDKQSIDNIENENMRKALMTVENIIPMNTWDIDYGVTKMPGAYVGEEHVLTMTEKLEMIAKLKSADPAIQSEVRKTILKSPIMAANAAAGTVGVKLDIIIKNMDFFLPKLTDPNFEQMQSIEDATSQWETLRREMQTDVNELYPTFQGGLRVTFPPTRVIQNAMRTKRPVSTRQQMPITVHYTLKNDKDYVAKHEVQFVLWKENEDYATQKVVFPLEAPEEIEKFGIKREEKPVWKNYIGGGLVTPGVFRYHWMFDGKPFFNTGAPYGDEFKPGETYQSFSVMCAVQFGIGVQM